jgi:hypothetical protein
MPIEEEKVDGGKGKEKKAVVKTVDDLFDAPIESEKTESKEEKNVISQEQYDALKKQMSELLKKVEDSTNPSPAAISNEASSDLKELANLLRGNSGGEKDKLFDKNNQFIFTNNDYGDEDDMLDKKDWQVFTSYTIYDIVATDVKNGRPIKAPIKPIEFTYLSSNTEWAGKEQDVVHMCKYVCKSKAELEFLLNHSNFGTKFFKTASFNKKHASIHSRWASKVNAMIKLGQYELRRLCADLGIEFDPDLKESRSSIALEQIKREDLKSASDTGAAVAENYMEMKKLEKQ